MSHSSENNPPFSMPVRVLVVDDDTTCLSIVDAMLKKWNYEVVAVKHPLDALCILRMNSGSFDLVVLDVHMPEMNGFELQQLIIEEFDLPVVLMSADDKEAIILKGIEGGAVYFISKPIDPDDLKDLWQFAAIKKKNKAGTSGKENENGKGKGATNIVVDDKGYSDGNESSVNEDRQVLAKRKYTKNGNIDDNNGEENTVLCSTQRKQKVVWSGELHNRFLEAINNIGLERAVPKKILEEMNVPGLTRENVASHLQKYRIFLKRLADLSNMDRTGEKSFSNRFFRSSLMSKNPALTLDKIRQQQMRTFYSRGYERYAPVLDSSNLGDISFPILETSSSNFMARSSSSGNWQSSSLLSNQDISMQMYQPPAQATSKSLGSGLESNYGLTKFGIGSSAFVTRETSSNSSLMQNHNRFNNSNYVGFGMMNNDQTTELGQMGFINASNGFILNKGLANNDGIDQNNKLNSTASSDLWNGGEVNLDTLFGLMNDTTSAFNMILPPAPPYDCSTDINSAFTSQVDTRSSTQEQYRDEDADFWSSFDSFHIGDIDVPMDEQFSTEQQQGAESMVITSNSSSGMNQSHAYFPWIDQNLISQRDDEAYLESVFSPSPSPSPSPYDQANISFGGQSLTRRTSDQA